MHQNVICWSYSVRDAFAMLINEYTVGMDGAVWRKRKKQTVECSNCITSLWYIMDRKMSANDAVGL